MLTFVHIGFLYSAQRKWRNGENKRTLILTLSLTLNLTLNDYFRRCAVCVAPFALRRIQIAVHIISYHIIIISKFIVPPLHYKRPWVHYIVRGYIVELI